MKNIKHALSVREMAIFSMLAALMFCSKVIMDALPNIHLLGMFIMVYTIVFRAKALIPIYLFIFMTGLYGGFGLWWIPYLYLWAILWGVTMLLPRNMPRRVAIPVYMGVCALHGLCFGTLYAPFQAVVFGLDFAKTLAWIAAGLPFDVIHALGNLAAGALIVPLVELLRRLEKSRR